MDKSPSMDWCPSHYKFPEKKKSPSIDVDWCPGHYKFPEKKGTMASPSHPTVITNEKEKKEDALYHLSSKSSCITFTCDHTSFIEGLNTTPYFDSKLLVFACRVGSLQIVEALITLRPPLLNDVFRKLNMTPLMLASYSGHIHICEYLIYHGAAVDFVDNEKMTALHAACMKGHIDICKLLLKEGALSMVTNNQGHTPLSLAALNGHINVCELIVRDFSLINTQRFYIETELTVTNPLIAAAEGGYCDVCQYFLSNGWEVNAFSRIQNATALSTASGCGHKEVCSLLLKNGAIVNHGPQGHKPIHKAVSKNHSEVVELLIHNGAQFNYGNNSDDVNLLNIAAFNGHIEVVKTLLKHGAPFSVETLSICSRQGNIEMAKFFIDEIKSDPKKYDIDEKQLCEALTYALSDIMVTIHSRNVNSDFIQLLLEAGADPNANVGLPLQSAISNRRLDICQMLVKHGAHVNSLSDCYLPLREACLYYQDDICKLLLENGARVDKEISHSELSPLLFIFSRGMPNTRCMSLLLEYGIYIDTETIEILQNFLREGIASPAFSMESLQTIAREREKRNMNILKCLLCWRHFCEDSPFFHESFPLDIFKLILAFSQVSPNLCQKPEHFETATVKKIKVCL